LLERFFDYNFYYLEIIRLNYKERQEIIAKSPISYSYLKKFNLAAGILHLSQGIIMLVLGTLLTWNRAIYTFYLKLDITPGTPPIFNIAPDPQIWFTLSYLGVIVASFPLLSALAHFLIAFPKNKAYMKT
jgi:hypothetical protein